MVDGTQLGGQHVTIDLLEDPMHELEIAVGARLHQRSHLELAKRPHLCEDHHVLILRLHFVAAGVAASAVEADGGTSSGDTRGC